MMTLEREDPTQPDLALLHERHTEAMNCDTPPESVHMIPASGLKRPDIAFFVLRESGKPLAMGAWKLLSAAHAEIKSMHVLQEARGRGLARQFLRDLIAQARFEGIERLSLETGVQPSFIAARGLYLSEGFEECPPFGDYRLDPNSVFMTRAL
ncbi:GNAT family N-acetyltransferase [Albirhodobacter sp. R86504]|jgi:putative acetyltransferase|uniref:GNAT family N-acetyltransferase n=1 Tax=Albirhodobacter sp. R86504 TaxID=3093848 RepID=UPI0036726469